MIPRDELRRWLGDCEAQDATAHRLESVTRQLRELRLLKVLRTDLDALSHRDAGAILACAGKAMADEDGLEEIFACLVNAAAADPFFRPALRNVASDIHSGILLFDTPDLTLFVAVMPVDALAAKRMGRDGARSVVFPGQRSLYKFVRAGGAMLSLWEAPMIAPGFRAETSGRCRLAERRRLANGDVLELDGRRQTFVIDHASADLVYLQAITPAGRAPLSVEYDSDTLKFVGASSTDEVSSRAQMMLALLRTLDRQDAVPVMIDMLGDANFYARWQAMRELLALDAEAALPRLRAMAGSDPHPEVRTAAADTLLACFPPPGTAAERPLVLENI
jgi:hypothetical protein